VCHTKKKANLRIQNKHTHTHPHTLQLRAISPSPNEKENGNNYILRFPLFLLPFSNGFFSNKTKKKKKKNGYHNNNFGKCASWHNTGGSRRVVVVSVILTNLISISLSELAFYFKSKWKSKKKSKNLGWGNKKGRFDNDVNTHIKLYIIKKREVFLSFFQIGRNRTRRNKAKRLQPIFLTWCCPLFLLYMAGFNFSSSS
jgi:hypothetical protein